MAWAAEALEDEDSDEGNDHNHVLRSAKQHKKRRQAVIYEDQEVEEEGGRTGDAWRFAEGQQVDDGNLADREDEGESGEGDEYGEDLAAGDGDEYEENESESESDTEEEEGEED